MECQVDTRTRIINTAAELFYRHGFESVGLLEICTKAKVSKSSFYHFFSSKAEVAVAVVKAHWQSGKQILDNILSSSQSPLQKIQAIFADIFSMTESMGCHHGEDFGCPFGNLASELSNSNPALREQMQFVFDSMMNVFIDLIDQAKAEGELTETVDSRGTAKALLMSLLGMRLLGKVYNDSAEMRRDGEYALKLILEHKQITPSA